MAVRVFKSFHTKGARSPKMLATAVAMLAWKLALESIKRMRKADYDIDVGPQYYDFVAEYLVFLAHSADRIAYRLLDAEPRGEFTTGLVIRLSEMIEESRREMLGDLAPGDTQGRFVELFNRRGEDYGEYDYGAEGPSFGFKRMFGAALRDVLPEKDQLWVIDQAMDIEAPAALKAIEKSMAGLFGGGGGGERSESGGHAQTSSGMGGE